MRTLLILLSVCVCLSCREISWFKPTGMAVNVNGVTPWDEWGGVKA